MVLLFAVSWLLFLWLLLIVVCLLFCLLVIVVMVVMFVGYSFCLLAIVVMVIVWLCLLVAVDCLFLFGKQHRKPLCFDCLLAFVVHCSLVV